MIENTENAILLGKITDSQGFLKKLIGPQTRFNLFCMLAAFITYMSMYAFRKPFSAGTYEGLTLWGVDYKIVLIISQVLGYMLSKFIGISVISGMKPGRRVFYILLFIGISWLGLLLFALVPHPYNFVFMFVNGAPLGMIWGLVFSFLEGRKSTELLGTSMCISFIVASGMAKFVGRFIMSNFGVTEFWMPFMVGLLFVVPLIIGVWLLGKIPPPTKEDVELRTERVPMNRKQRMDFFKAFAMGIVLVIFAYCALTIYRDLRDNFAVEIWSQLGYQGDMSVLATAEVPIAILVLVITAMMIKIRSNSKAFFVNIAIVISGGLLLIGTTAMFAAGIISPMVWMIGSGFGLYLGYVCFQTTFLERWIATFRYKSNIGFLMYVIDAFGYLASVFSMFYKDFFARQTDWLSFITTTAYYAGGVIVITSVAAYFYFRKKEQRINI